MYTESTLRSSISFCVLRGGTACPTFLDNYMPAGFSISPPVADIPPLERADKLLSDSAEKIMKLSTESACSDDKEMDFFDLFPYQYQESNKSWVHADLNINMDGIDPETGEDEIGFDEYGSKDGKLKTGYSPGGNDYTKDYSWSESFSPSDRPPQ